MAPAAIKIYRGVSIYKVDGSANWYVRVWDQSKRRYIVKTTGVRSAVRAREIAKEFALDLLRTQKPVDREFTFRHFALKCLSISAVLVKKGERHSRYDRVIQWAIQNDDWGLLRRFGANDQNAGFSPLPRGARAKQTPSFVID